MIKRCAAAVWAILLLAPDAYGADLLSSWRATRVNDPVFAAAQDALAAGLEKSRQGDAAILPRASLDAGADQLNENFRPGGSGSAASALSGRRYGLGVSLSQPLFDASAFAGRAQLKTQSLQARVQYRIAEQDLILRVAKAYFEVLLARENVKLVAEQMEAVSQQLAQAKKTFEVGSSTITDSNEAQARYDAIIASDIAARNDLRIKSTAYERLTRLDAGRLAPISDTRAPSPPEPASLDAWISRTPDNLTIQAQELGLEVARIDIERYRLENSPVVSLVASYGSQWESHGISSSGGRDRTATGVVGVQLSIPLFTGGLRSSQLREALALRDQQSHSLEAIQRDTEQSIQQFFLNVESGAAQIRALEQARISSESSLDSSKVGREVGVRTTVDVLNAEQNYYQTLYNLVAARYQYLFNKLQLAASVGGLNELELERVNGWLAPVPDTPVPELKYGYGKPVFPPHEQTS